MHRLVEQTIMLLIMFSLPAKGQKFGKVFTMIQIIMIFFQLAKVSPMILQKKRNRRMNNKAHKDNMQCKIN
jgi:hypothetical protein